MIRYNPPPTDPDVAGFLSKHVATCRRALAAHQKTEAGKVFPVTRCAPMGRAATMGQVGWPRLGSVLLEMYAEVSPWHGHPLVRASHGLRNPAPRARYIGIY